MINFYESMGPGQDHTRDPWICSQISSVARHVTGCATRPDMCAPLVSGQHHVVFCSLISVFVILSGKYHISKLATCKVYVSQLVSVAELTSLSLNWSETPKTDFLTMKTNQLHVLGIQIRLA